jgi:hypothetical protein
MASDCPAGVPTNILEQVSVNHCGTFFYNQLGKLFFVKDPTFTTV